MFIVDVSKVVVTDSGDEILYAYSAHASTLELATLEARIFASMVEYGMLANKWTPDDDMAFPREQLLQFIQPSQLEILERMYPDVVTTAYSNAYAYIQSYIGNMFNVDEILEQSGLSSTSLILRLALCIKTAMFILASVPQYSETLELHNRDLHRLLKGLKSGNRNFGRDAIIEEPDVRVSVVNLGKPGSRP